MAIGMDTLIAENERLRSEKAALMATVADLQKVVRDLMRAEIEARPVIVTPFLRTH